MFSMIFLLLFIFKWASAAVTESCQQKIERAVDSLPEGYKLKLTLREVSTLVSDEWLGKFSDKPVFGEFAKKLEKGKVQATDTPCDRLVQIIPKLPQLTFEQSLEASDVLQVTRAIEQKETSLLSKLDEELELLIMSDVQRTKQHLKMILKDEKRATPLKYQSVLMDIHDIFSSLTDPECGLTLNSKKIVGCGRRDAYKVIDTIRSKWPEWTETTPVLFFSILKQLEELAGDIVEGRDLNNWTLEISKLTKEKDLPELWMHRVRMMDEGLQDSGFGEVSDDPWYRSTPFVIFICLITTFLVALFTITIYYVFLQPKPESVQQRPQPVQQS